MIHALSKSCSKQEACLAHQVAAAAMVLPGHLWPIIRQPSCSYELQTCLKSGADQCAGRSCRKRLDSWAFQVRSCQLTPPWSFQTWTGAEPTIVGRPGHCSVFLLAKLLTACQSCWRLKQSTQVVQPMGAASTEKPCSARASRRPAAGCLRHAAAAANSWDKRGSSRRQRGVPANCRSARVATAGSAPSGKSFRGGGRCGGRGSAGLGRDARPERTSRRRRSTMKAAQPS